MGFLCKPPNRGCCTYQQCGCSASCPSVSGISSAHQRLEKQNGEITSLKKIPKPKFTMPFAMWKNCWRGKFTVWRLLLLQRFDDRIFYMWEQQDTEYRTAVFFALLLTCVTCPTTPRGIWGWLPRKRGSRRAKSKFGHKKRKDPRLDQPAWETQGQSNLLWFLMF